TVRGGPAGCTRMCTWVWLPAVRTPTTARSDASTRATTQARNGRTGPRVGSTAMTSRPATLGQLRESGWVSRPVKEEVRANAVARISAGEALFPGVLGYDETVLPQLENALLAGHDIIFLGERGQAKTRIMRSLTAMLDEW